MGLRKGLNSLVLRLDVVLLKCLSYEFGFGGS